MKPTKPAPTGKSQAERLLEATRKTRADNQFARTMGKTTLAKQARKTAKGQIGG